MAVFVPASGKSYSLVKSLNIFIQKKQIGRAIECHRMPSPKEKSYELTLILE